MNITKTKRNWCLSYNVIYEIRYKFIFFIFLTWATFIITGPFVVLLNWHTIRHIVTCCYQLLPIPDNEYNNTHLPVSPAVSEYRATQCRWFFVRACCSERVKATFDVNWHWRAITLASTRHSMQNHEKWTNTIGFAMTTASGENTNTSDYCCKTLIS